MFSQKKCGDPLTPRDSPSCQFALHYCVVFGVDTRDAMRTRHVGQYTRVRDVLTFLEEGLTQSEADGFTNSATLTVGRGRDCKSW